MLLPLVLTSLLQAQTVRQTQGIGLCDSVYSGLTHAGLKPAREDLAPTGTDDFPYNIVLTFPAQYKTAASQLEDLRDTVILVFNQQDYSQYKNDIHAILADIQDVPLTYTVKVLFAAPGCQQLAGNDSLRGIEVYAANIDEPDIYCAAAVHFISGNGCIIIPGGAGESAPDWLIKDLATACSANKKKYDIISGSLLSLYRFKVLHDDIMITPFLRNTIPAAGISIPAVQNGSAGIATSILHSFLTVYNPQKTTGWDRHYTILNLGGREIWLNETFFVVCYLSVAVFSLFILCGLAFMGGWHALKNWNDFWHSWYILPATIVLSAFSLYLGQWFVSVIKLQFGLTPILQFGIKLLISFLIVSFLFIFEVFYKGRDSQFIYGFQITLMSVFNIFIFSALDLSLFFLFAFEYVFIYMSRPMRRSIPLAFSIFIIFIPFIPYCLELWKYADSEKLEQLVYGTFTENIFLACAVLPFHVTWLRFFSRFITAKLDTVTKGTIIKVFLSISISALCLFSFFFALSKALMNYRAIPVWKNGQAEPQIIKNSSRTAVLSFKDTSYLGISTRQLEIHSAKPAARYIIKVAGKSGIPVYDSQYSFSKQDSDDNAVYFTIPDWPPQHMSIQWSANPLVQTAITVTALYQNGDFQDGPAQFISEQYTISGLSPAAGGK